MSISHTAFIGLVSALVAGMSATFFAILRKERRSTMQTWEAIVAKLNVIDLAAMCTIIQSNKSDEAELEVGQLFSLAGGLPGLERIEANCDVLIELATFIQRWHPEALIVAEDLRLDARRLRWHVDRLKSASANGHLLESFPEYAHGTVAIYESMRQKLLHLCRTIDSSSTDGLVRGI